MLTIVVFTLLGGFVGERVYYTYMVFPRWSQHYDRLDLPLLLILILLGACIGFGVGWILSAIFGTFFPQVPEEKTVPLLQVYPGQRHSFMMAGTVMIPTTHETIKYRYWGSDCRIHEGEFDRDTVEIIQDTLTFQLTTRSWHFLKKWVRLLATPSDTQREFHVPFGTF